ncbi:MAG: HAMP domain-containing histidine kinase [Phycisphaeraceae bacterium]|nr:MAG: HAMP domain-containing histidine kinase [Phycisphaeraceae bacterium]
MNDAMEHHEGAGPGRDLPITGGRSGPARSRKATGGAPDAADRLTALTHELRNLLDGSLRWISIAERDLPSPGDADLGDELERTRRQLETVRRALMQMNELVRTSMSAGLSLGTPIMSPSERISLGEALDHAVDVASPRASSLGIELSIAIDGQAGPRAAGAMYSVMLNGLHNAIDSIERRLAGKAGSGRIEARLGWTERGGLHRVVLEIADDGVGPPAMEDPGGVFEPGFTTKDGGQGIGLALSRQIVQELGGRIELVKRKDVAGAVLRAVFPAPSVVEIEDV